MAKFQITAPDGATYEIEAPEGATEAQAVALLQQSLAPAEAEEETNGLGLAQQFAEGFTFGGFGEITAGTSTLTDYFKRGMPSDYPWKKMLAGAERQIQEKMDEYAQENPKKSIAANLAGGVTSGGAGMARALGTQAIKQLPTVARWAVGGLVGAAEGATAGALSARPGERARGAAIGGGLGAGLSLGVGAGGAALGRHVVDPIATRVSGKMRGQRAVDFVEQAMARDKITPEQATAKMAATGSQAALVDVGENVRALGDYVINRPGTAKAVAREFLETRRAGQVGRILDKVEAAVGPAGREAMERTEGSQAFKDALLNMVPMSRGLLKTMSRPSMRSGWNRARQLAAEQDQMIPPFDDFVQGVQGGKIKEIETTVLHWLKKGLDDAIEPKRDAFGNIAPPFGRNKMEALKNTRSQFRESVKKANPEYGKQLDRLSREFKVDEALEKGKKALNLRNPDLIKMQMRGMGERERRAYRNGVMEAIENKITAKADTGDDASKLVLNHAPKLRAVFGPKADDLINSIKGERRMARTEASFGGSQTQPRQMAARDIEGGALADVTDATIAAAQGGAQGIPRLMGRAARAAGKPPAPVIDEISRMLFSGDAREVSDAIAQLKAARASGQRLTAGGLRSGISGGAATLGGLYGSKF